MIRFGVVWASVSSNPLCLLLEEDDDLQSGTNAMFEVWGSGSSDADAYPKGITAAGYYVASLAAD